MPRKAHSGSGSRKRTRTSTTGIVEGWRRESAATGTFYNFTQGLHRVRILPGFDDKSDEFWFTNVMHHGFTVDNRRIAPCCYDFHFGISCPVCTTVNWLREHKAELTQYADLAQRFSSRRKFIVNVNPHGMQEVKLASLGQKAMDQIFSFFTMPEYGDISDEESGTDLYIERKGDGFDTVYNVTPVPNSTGPISIKNWDQRLKDPAKEVRIVPYKDLVQLLIDHMPDTVPVAKIVAVAPRKQPTLVKAGGSMPRKKVDAEFTIPIDPETSEPLEWFEGDEEEEACWWNRRTETAYVDIPAPPEGWEPSEDDGDGDGDEDEFEAPVDEETDEYMEWNESEEGWEDSAGNIWTEDEDGEDYAAPPEGWEPPEDDEPEPEPAPKKRGRPKGSKNKAKVTKKAASKKKASKKTTKKAGKKKKSSKKAGKKKKGGRR